MQRTKKTYFSKAEKTEPDHLLVAKKSTKRRIQSKQSLPKAREPESQRARGSEPESQSQSQRAKAREPEPGPKPEPTSPSLVSYNPTITRSNQGPRKTVLSKISRRPGYRVWGGR